MNGVKATDRISNIKGQDRVNGVRATDMISNTRATLSPLDLWEAPPGWLQSWPDGRRLAGGPHAGRSDSPH